MTHAIDFDDAGIDRVARSFLRGASFARGPNEIVEFARSCSGDVASMLFEAVLLNSCAVNQSIDADDVSESLIPASLAKTLHSDLAGESQISANKRQAIIKDAIERVLRAVHGTYGDLKVFISRRGTTWLACRELFVYENSSSESSDDGIPLEVARETDLTCMPGDTIRRKIPIGPLGGISLLSVREFVHSHIRQERSLLLEQLTSANDLVCRGVVKHLDNGAVVVSCGQYEGRLPLSQALPSDEFHAGSPLAALIVGTEKKVPGSQLTLSRKHDRLLLSLLHSKIDSSIKRRLEVKAISRAPGRRSKIAFASKCLDEDVPLEAYYYAAIDVSFELSGEQIDIVQWSDDIRQFVLNSLPSLRSKSITTDEAQRIVNIVACRSVELNSEEVQMAANLTNWNICVKYIDANPVVSEATVKSAHKKAGTRKTEKYARQIFAVRKRHAIAQLRKIGLSTRLAEKLWAEGITRPDQLEHLDNHDGRFTDDEYNCVSHAMRIFAASVTGSVIYYSA